MGRLPEGRFCLSIPLLARATITLVVLLITCLAPTSAAAANKRVLFFFSMRQESPNNALAEKYLINSLRDALHGQLDYYTEFIDEPRFSNPVYLPAMRDFLSQKYEGKRFDLIVTTQRPALGFVTQFGNELFPGTPVFFIAGKGIEIPNDRPGPNFTGILYKVDLRPTLELALKLQPGLKRIYAITGTSTFDQHYEQGAKDQWRGFEGKLQFTYSSGATLEELSETISRLPSDTAVTLVTMTEDRLGNHYVQDEVLAQITKVANVPVYSFRESDLQHGVLGGNVISFERIYAQALPGVLRVLGGERADDIAVQEVYPTAIEFNWQQLKRFKISESSLPSGSIVLFREETFWERYRWRIVGVISIVLVQSLLIAALLFQRSRSRHATNSLAESEARYRNVVETQTELICRFRPDTTLTFVNDAYCRYFGKTREELLGTKFIELMPPEAKVATQAHIDWLITHPPTAVQEHPVFLPNGEIGWQQWINHVATHNGGAPELQGIGRDVTERKLAEEKRIEAEHELIQLTSRLFRLQDDERRRIARELHDGTAQNLFAITMNLAKLSKLDTAQNEKLQNLIAECNSLGNQVLQEIRTMSYLLHPPLLDQGGLVPAVQWYCTGFSQRSGINVDVFTEPIGRLSSETELALFRIVQESLTNVRRHSGSDSASIRLTHRNGDVQLEIRDHGTGLSSKKQKGEVDKTIEIGVGISGMRQRMQQLGGKLEIYSNRDGTRVSAIVPANNHLTDPLPSSNGDSGHSIS